MKRVICGLLALLLALGALPLGVWAYPESTYPTTVNAGSLNLTLAFDQSYMSSPTSMSISLQGGLITERSQVHPGGDADVRAITYNARVSPGQTITLRADGTPHGQSVKSEMETSILVEQSTVETSERSGSVSYTVRPGDRSIHIRAQFKDYYSHYNNYIFEFTVVYTVVEDAAPAPAPPANNAPTSHPNHPPGSCWLCGGEDSGARFNDLYGEVSYRCNDDEDDGYEYAELDTVLHVNDRIRTREDSGAILQFINMRTFTMRPESIAVLLPREKNSKVKLIAGQFWVDLKKALTDGVIDIEMSQAAASIKGTVLSFEETGDTSTVWLFTSSAEITSKTTGEVVTLQPGQKATVTANAPIAVEPFNIEELAAEFEIPMETIEADRQENGYLDTEGIDGIVDIEGGEEQAAATKPEDYGNYVPDGAKDDTLLYFVVGLVFILLVLAAVGLVVVLVVRAARARKAQPPGQPPWPGPAAPPGQQAGQSWPPQNTAPPPQPRYCPGCGAPCGPNAKFCNSCGGPLQ